MVILDFLTSNPDVVVAIGGAVAGWLGLKKRDDGLAKLKDKALARLRQEAIKLLEEHATAAKARTAMEWAADGLLNDLGIKRSKTVDAIVEVIIEQAMKEYAERLGMATLRLYVEQLFGAVSKLPAAFDADAAKLEASEAAFRASSNVEVVTELPK